MVPTRDTRALTLACLDSLTEQGRDDLEVIVVDDGSRDDTVDGIARRHPEVGVLRNKVPRGFSVSANRGLRSARGRILVLLNSDTEIVPGSFEPLLRAFRRDPSLGIAGARLVYPDGAAQWSGGEAPTLLWLFGLTSGLPGWLGRLPGYRRLRPLGGVRGGEVDWVTGAALAMRRRVWRETGPLDEGFAFYCQDLAFCLQARAAGWRVAVVPGFEVRHHHGATISRGAGDPGAHGRLDVLVGDLRRWARIHRGEAWADRAARVMRWGLRLRLLAHRSRGLLLTGARRRAWRQRYLYLQGVAAALAEAEFH